MLTVSARSAKVTTGRHLSVRVPRDVDAVRTSIGRSPRKTTRRCSQDGMSAMLNVFLSE